MVHKYFPWKDKSFKPSSLENMVKQWHSIESVFHLMDSHAKLAKKEYSRVGIFRSDTMFVTPIDIFDLGRSEDADSPRYDENNEYFVTPSFCMFPVNDRMIYGPYDAVKIWATKRFDHLETRAAKQFETKAAKQNDSGHIMKPERILDAVTFKAMERQGYKSRFNSDICFMRARAQDEALASDCWFHFKGQFRTHWNNNSATDLENQLADVRSLIGEQCQLRDGEDRKKKMFDCSRESKDMNENRSPWKILSSFFS